VNESDAAANCPIALQTSKALRIILVIQFVLGAIWISPLLTELQNSLGSLYLFVLIYPFHLFFFLTACFAAADSTS